MKRLIHIVMPLLAFGMYFVWFWVMGKSVSDLDTVRVTIYTNCVTLACLVTFDVVLVPDLAVFPAVESHPTCLRASHLGFLFAMFWFVTQETGVWLSYRNPSNLEIGSVRDYVSLTLLFAPILEECLVRGVLQGHLREIMNPAIACLVSSVVFGALHGSVSGLYVGFTCGLFFGMLYEWTGSLSLAIAFHSLYNLAALGAGMSGAFRFVGSMPIGSILIGNVILLVVFFRYWSSMYARDV